MPEPLDLGPLTALTKERYETGAYGGCHLVIAADVLEAVRLTAPVEPPSRLDFALGFAAPMQALLGIPIVVDELLEPGHWRLVETLTREIRREGRLTPPTTDRDSGEVTSQ